MVAALEFDTTYFGFAFSFVHTFKTDPLKIETCSIWNYLCLRPKTTPASLLLDKEKQCVAFGYDAENLYAQLVMNEVQDNYYFFDRFTMSLHHNEVISLK